MAYSEQDGAYRQVGGKIRLGPHCQARAMKMSAYFNWHAFRGAVAARALDHLDRR